MLADRVLPGGTDPSASGTNPVTAQFTQILVDASALMNSRMGLNVTSDITDSDLAMQAICLNIAERIWRNTKVGQNPEMQIEPIRNIVTREEWGILARYRATNSFTEIVGK
jgi:hypothetical protein